MDTKALRQKILDLAIRGKLVPQDPNDEPASALLERIRAEKQQMVKDGKLKAKDIKNDTVIYKADDNLHYEQFQDGTVKCIEDEIPFELPDGWAWCRLNALLNVCSSKRVLQSEWKKEGIPFYRAREIVKLSENGYVDNELFISEEYYRQLNAEYGAPKAGDLMVSGVGTIGKVYVVQKNDCFYYKDASVLCFENRTGAILSEYARYMLESEFIQRQMKEKSKGTTVDTITISTAMMYLCVLPPLKEQFRIISTVENSLKYISSINDNKNDLVTLISHAKSKILDLAIRGKLVPQDPNDEPASVLLERICAEKEELIKQGKIKRDKKESVIFKGDDNSYYDIEIPERWEVVSLASITKSISDGSHNPPPDSHRGIPILSATNIYGNDIHINSASRWVTQADWIIENKRTNIEMGDVLLTIVGSIGRAAVVDKDDHFALQRSVAVIKPLSICAKYLMYFFESPAITNFFERNSKGTAQKGIYLNALRELKIFIPPLAEQQHIVVAIETYYKKLDKIAEMLT